MDPCEEDLKQGCGGENNYESAGSEWTEEGNENVSDREEQVVEEDCTDYAQVVGLTSAGIMRKRFRSEEAAYEFYKRFGKCHGFGIRKGDFGKDDAGRVIRRRLFCNKAGLRDPKHYNRVDRRREHKPKTRTNCKAKLSIYLEVETGLWRVSKVVTEHNHELTPATMIHMIPTFRSMSECAKAQMDGMQDHGVATSKILGYMAGQAGGYSFVGFTKKDAYNYVEKSKRARIVDGDANAAIGYLEGKVNSDNMSTARYLLTEDKMLAHIFWADGGSRIDYQYFGDVLAFDSTYKKNKYKRPLVIFSGANNHKQTTIFGFALLLDETVASYKWLLENFLEAMCQKKPSVIVTDGDEAMRAAIRAVLPDATHRLCAWHLEKNVTTNVRWEGLRSKFNKWLYAEMEVEEFEVEWEDAMVQFGTGDRFWFKETYEKRRMWANAYLRDKFCVGFRTTSRCEGINAYVKKFVKSRHSLLEMLQGLELMVREYRNNELEAQFKSVHGFPVLTTGLEQLERHAAKVYTREVFFDVRKEVEGVMEVNFVSKVKWLNTMVYTLEGYTEPGRHVVVLFERNSRRLQCGCGVWKRRGFPCRHMFFVMKHEHLTEIPDRLVLKRWRKDAKSLDHYGETRDEGSERGFLLRHGALNAASKRLVYVGAKSHASFNHAVVGLLRLCDEIDGKTEPVSQPGVKEQTKEGGRVKDPVVVRTKGAPRLAKKNRGRKRRCTICRRPGHTKRHCRTGEFEGLDAASLNKKADSELASHSSSPDVTFPQSVCRGLKRKARDGPRRYTGCDKSVAGTANAEQNTKQSLSQDSSSSDEYLKEVVRKFTAVGDRIAAALKRV